MVWHFVSGLSVPFHFHHLVEKVTLLWWNCHQLCIALFLRRLIVTGSVYLLLGFLYQRFVVGAKGLEQIPNYTFWTNFGSLQAVSLLSYVALNLLYMKGKLNLNLRRYTSEVFRKGLLVISCQVHETLTNWGSHAWSGTCMYAGTHLPIRFFCLGCPRPVYIRWRIIFRYVQVASLCHIWIRFGMS